MDNLVILYEYAPLLLKDPTAMRLDNNVQIYHFGHVPFGGISSPFLLAATISYHLQQIDNQFAEVVKQDIYVDNIVTGVNAIEEAKTLYSEAKSLFATASMNLREWASNLQQFMESVPHPIKQLIPSRRYLALNGIYPMTHCL